MTLNFLGNPSVRVLTANIKGYLQNTDDIRAGYASMDKTIIVLFSISGSIGFGFLMMWLVGVVRDANKYRENRKEIAH